MNADFPLASDADEAVVISGRVWNRVVSVLKYAQGLSVSAPLMMQETPGGPVIALRQTASSPVKLLRYGSNHPGGGKYLVYKVDAPTSDVSTSGNLTTAELGASGSAAMFLNSAEVGSSTHDLSGSNKPQEWLGVLRKVNSDGTEVYGNFAFQSEDCAAGSGGAPAATSNNFLLMGA